jgi:hypothetical protein
MLPHRKQPGLVLPLVSCCVIAWFIFRLWRWRQYVPPKRRSTSTALFKVPPQNTVKSWCVIVAMHWRKRNTWFTRTIFANTLSPLYKLKLSKFLYLQECHSQSNTCVHFYPRHAHSHQILCRSTDSSALEESIYLIIAFTKITIFWDEKPWGLVRTNHRFRWTYRLHFRGRIVVGKYLSDATASDRKTQKSSLAALWKPQTSQLMHALARMKFLWLISMLVEITFNWVLMPPVKITLNITRNRNLLWLVNALLGNGFVNKFPQRQILGKEPVARLRNNRWSCFLCGPGRTVGTGFSVTSC